MIKIGYLISYDYDLLFTSLAQVYDHADAIVIAIDIDRKTWSGNLFVVAELFFAKLKAFDTQNKITIYEDNFCIPSLTPMENETRERNMLLKKMGKGWLIQLDVDEYVYDFASTVRFLKKLNYLLLFPAKTPVVFRGELITLYRKLDNGFLYIENGEKFPFITNIPHYTLARNNYDIYPDHSHIKVIHQSWARDESEILQKIKNWGHRDDFDTVAYFEFWKTLNSENYDDFKNIHPLVPEVWNELKFLECTDIDDFIKKYAAANPQKLRTFTVKKKIKMVLQSFFKKK